MSSNEENARTIVAQCLRGAKVPWRVGAVDALSRRIVACLAEVELVAPEPEVVEFSLVMCIASYHDVSLPEARNLVFAGFFSINGTRYFDADVVVPRGSVVQSTHPKYYASFIV